MKIKDYLLVIVILLFVSILFIPAENANMAIGVGILALILTAVYFLIRKK